MFWKDQLAREILAQSQCTYHWLLDLRTRFPQLRVKTIDAGGKVPVIRFDDRNGEWIKPKEWAENHCQSISCKFQESLSRMKALGYDLSTYFSKGAQKDTSVGSQHGDNVSIDEMQRRINVLGYNYKCAMHILKYVSSGGALRDQDRIKIAEYDESRPTLIF